MRFTDLFVKRPVLAIVVNLVILIAGLQAIRALSVRQYPRSDIAVVRISTVYVGANADLVRGFITTPLERVIASADGIDYLESSSAQSLSTITVHLTLNYDTNAALTQIQSKVAQVRNDLPPEAEVLWQTGETDVSGFPIEGQYAIPEKELTAAMADADLVIAHAGVGAALAAFEVGKCPVLVPRRLSRNEHIDDHQIQVAAELGGRGVAVATEADELRYEDLQRAAKREVRRLSDPPQLETDA